MDLEIPWSKDQLKDTTNRPLTQSLFLEFGYNTQYALFTLNDDDKTYEDKVYYSLKRFYLAMEDPTEAIFARRCLLGWRHWKRLCENKLFQPYLEEWRDELDYQMRSGAIRSIIDQSENNFQAAKWLADRGWEKRQAGRPSKAEKERQETVNQRILEELEDTVVRMDNYRKID